MNQNYPSKQDLHSMPNSILIESTELLVRKERQLIEVLIWHLQEIQDRKLFMSMGYNSLYECFVKHFKYSESVAYQRISALKILKTVPLASQSLKEGKVSLTTLSQIQGVIQKQEKSLGEKLSLETKQSYLKSIENKTSQEVKQVIAEINPILVLPHDKVIHLTKDEVQLQITVDQKLLKKINDFKSLISHENINPSYNEILHEALSVLIETTQKKKGLVTCKDQNVLTNKLETSEAKQVVLNNKSCNKKITQSLLVRNFDTRSKSPTRYISRNVKRQVLTRSQSRCEHTSKKGQRCESQFQLQFDHIQPVSFGGHSKVSNIQLLCRTHNIFKGNNVV